MKTIWIDVTEDDIKNGIPFNSISCPVALAMRRATGKTCMVTRSMLYLDAVFHCGVWWTAGCAVPPPKAQMFIIEVDRYMPVEPISFQLEVEES